MGLPGALLHPACMGKENCNLRVLVTVGSSKPCRRSKYPL